MIRDTLLIIDDCDLDLVILKEMFKDQFVVECVSDARKGLAFLRQNKERVCAILLDIYLERPGEGFQVLKRLQADPDTSVFPVILITSDANEEAVRDSVRSGAVDFLAKPVDPHTVRERVSRLVKTVWPENSTVLDVKGSGIPQREMPRPKEEHPDGESSALEEARGLFEVWSRKLEAFCRLREGMDVESHRQLGQITTLLARRYAQLFPDRGLSEEEAEMIGMASVFCDIGLLGIPDKAIAENGNETEVHLHYQHTQLGYELLKAEGADAPLLRHAAEIALWHHKNVDGSGYPLDADGSAVPVSGQLARAALRVQHYLRYYRGYPDSRERMLRSVKGEAGVIFAEELYGVIEKESGRL